MEGKKKTNHKTKQNKTKKQPNKQNKHKGQDKREKGDSNKDRTDVEEKENEEVIKRWRGKQRAMKRQEGDLTSVNTRLPYKLSGLYKHHFSHSAAL